MITRLRNIFFITLITVLAWFIYEIYSAQKALPPEINIKHTSPIKGNIDEEIFTNISERFDSDNK